MATPIGILSRGVMVTMSSRSVDMANDVEAKSESSCFMFIQLYMI